MKDKILKLRTEGKTYNEICKLLNCSKSTVSYYCGEDQKNKTKERNRERRKNLLISKLESFKDRKQKDFDFNIPQDRNIKNISESLRKFQKRELNEINKNINLTFSWNDILNKFGENTVCYLSGEKINLFVNDYQFDHIIPVSRGGDNSLENLGILHKVVNQMKNNLTVDELLFWSKKLLENNGYKVIIK